MRRLVAIVSTTLAAIGVIATPSAQADSHFSLYVGAPAPVVVAPPVVRLPRVVAQPTDDDWYWQPGYRAWDGYDYRWVPGRWIRRAYGPSWDRRWERDRDRWEHERWERNRWEKERRHDYDDEDGWDRAREWRR